LVFACPSSPVAGASPSAVPVDDSRLFHRRISFDRLSLHRLSNYGESYRRVPCNHPATGFYNADVCWRAAGNPKPNVSVPGVSFHDGRTVGGPGGQLQPICANVSAKHRTDFEFQPSLQFLDGLAFRGSLANGLWCSGPVRCTDSLWRTDFIRRAIYLQCTADLQRTADL